MTYYLWQRHLAQERYRRRCGVTWFMTRGGRKNVHRMHRCLLDPGHAGAHSCATPGCGERRMA
jgi:hypothetical protein